MAFATPFIPAFRPSSILSSSCRSLRVPNRPLRLVPTKFEMRISSISQISYPSVARTYMTRDVQGLPVVHVGGLSRSSPPIWLLTIFSCAIIWVIRRLTVLKHLSRRYRTSNLKQDIARFYDEKSAAWEEVWGEHLHHGLYDVVDGKRIRGHTAQIRTMSELLRKGDLLDAKLPANAKVLDVGCGVGGASRFLARHFGEDCHVTGITLSPFQVKRAEEMNKDKGLDQRVNVQLRDALKTGFPDESFDVVWSLESAEHIEDKHQFLKECSRLLKPNGKIVMLAWCMRETTPPLSVAERFSLRRVMEEYCLPRIAPASEYQTELLRTGLRGVEVADWTERAAPFWGEVIRSAFLSHKGWLVLWKYGWPLIRSALATRHVVSAVNQGVLRFVVFSARKPTAEELKAEAEKAAELCCSASSLPSE